MGFLMYCDNKGCGKSQEPLLDKDTDDVYCSECGKTIQNITKFAKNSMRGMGQYKKVTKTQEAWTVKCEDCLKMSQPKMIKGGVLICTSCGKEHNNINPAYAHAIRQHLKGNLTSSK